MNNGLFTTTIGTMSSISPTVFRGDPRYLDVAACGQQLSPRQQLTGVPYAFWAPNAGTAEQVSGPFAGDVTGTQGASTVARLRGKPVSADPPSANQLLAFDGTTWVPKGLSALGPHVVAAGIVKADGTRRAPVVANLRVVSNAHPAGTLDLKFDGYAQPSSNSHSYVVKATPSFNTAANDMIQINFASFDADTFRLIVRDAHGISLTEVAHLLATELMLEVSRIAAQP